MKTIVTHIAPDVDAVTSVWLLRRFLPGWKDAELAFVPAGKTLNDEPADSNPDIHHVDTGMGMLDHHQTDEDTCAARRTHEYIAKSQKTAFGTHGYKEEALIRLLDVVNDIDHFREVYYPNADSDIYELGFVSILDGWKLLFSQDDHKIAEMGLVILDGIYKSFQNKLWAQHELDTKGVGFETTWGKGIGVETINDEVMKLSQRQGYVVAVRKDPKKGFVRIKGMPGSPVDFTLVCEELKKRDSQATWFLHASRRMLLNGSSKNPDSRPTTLTLKEVIEILKGSRG